MSDPLSSPRTGPNGPTMTPQHRALRVGSHPWTIATGGRLTTAERWRLVPPMLAAHASMAVGRSASAPRISRGRRRRLHIDIDELAPPSSILTRVAASHATSRLSRSLLNHSMRTYAFGAALGLLDGRHVDRELLFTAALLHDVGLSGGAGDGTDFTLASAALARQVACDVGLSRRGADIVMSAITLHHSPDVRASDGAVAQLLSAGAAVDVIGLRSWELPPATIAAIVERHPRLGFKREFSAAFHAEATRVPQGRVQFLERYAAFDLAIRLAPFPE